MKPRDKGRSGADLDPGAWIARHPLAPLCSAYSQVSGTLLYSDQSNTKGTQ